jgi:hypothetical protein
VERTARPLDAVFVQSADAITSGPARVILHGLSSSTIYFAEHPRREVGHIPTDRFLELWGAEADAFAAEPPSAVLSFLDDTADAIDDVVVLLREPRLEAGVLSYRVDVLDGTLPAFAGPCALFIDSSRRVLSRVSPTENSRLDA